jgi:hypothetical protein
VKKNPSTVKNGLPTAFFNDFAACDEKTVVG